MWLMLYLRTPTTVFNLFQMLVISCRMLRDTPGLTHTHTNHHPLSPSPLPPPPSHLSPFRVCGSERREAVAVRRPHLNDLESTSSISRIWLESTGVSDVI